jgi:hypothetical protein
MNEPPQSSQSPWWLGKAQRHHALLKFITICVIVALVILGLVVVVEKS